MTSFPDILRNVREHVTAGLIVQVEFELPHEISSFLTDFDWLPEGTVMVQIESHGRAYSSRLLGPSHAYLPVSGQSIRWLFSRAVGAAFFLNTLFGAARILKKKSVLDFPIHRFLFRSNVLPLLKRLGAVIIRPFLARQNTGGIVSDIAAERTRSKKTVINRLRRLSLENSCVARQLIHHIRGAFWLPISLHS